MKKFLYLLFILPMFGLLGCSEDEPKQDEEDYDNIDMTIMRPTFFIKVFDTAGRNLLEDGKISERYPDMAIKYNGEEILLNSCWYFKQSKIGKSYNIIFIPEEKEDKATAILDWGDGTSNRIVFSCDTHNWDANKAIVDNKYEFVPHGNEFMINFVK